MGLCSDCDKREMCVGLCPEAEVYVSQDNVEWKETPRIYTDPDRNELRVFYEDTGRDYPALSKTEKAILSHLAQRKSMRQIALELELSYDNVRKVLSNIKKKCESFSLL